MNQTATRTLALDALTVMAHDSPECDERGRRVAAAGIQHGSRAPAAEETGHPLLAAGPGTGCSASPLPAAFLAATPDAPLEAAAEARASPAVAAEVVAFFFFQAEDGIRDYKVTGVQTCALPI